MRHLLAFAAFAIAGCATAPPSTPATTAAVAVPAPAAAAGTQKATQVAQVDPDKKTCRRMMQTGSLQPQRVCSTAAEWAEYDRRSKEGADRMNELRRSGGITGDFNDDFGQRPSTSAATPERALH